MHATDAMRLYIGSLYYTIKNCYQDRFNIRRLEPQAQDVPLLGMHGRHHS